MKEPLTGECFVCRGNGAVDTELCLNCAGTGDHFNSLTPREHQLAAALNGLFEHPLSLTALNNARTALYAAGYTE